MQTESTSFTPPGSLMPAYFFRVSQMHFGKTATGENLEVKISAGAAKLMRTIKPTSSQVQALLASLAERIKASGLLVNMPEASPTVAFMDGSCMPWAFCTRRGSVGSLALVMEDAERLSGEGSEQETGSEFTFLSEHADTTDVAMALLVVVHTWAHWAYDLMLVHEEQERVGKLRLDLNAGLCGP